METPRKSSGRSTGPRHSSDHYDSPPPPECCRGRLFLLEYGLLIGLQLLCVVIDIAIWVLSAYSVIAAFCMTFFIHCVVLLPAVFLPLLFRRFATPLKRLQDWNVFHRYDWNIALGLVTIVSTVTCIVFILFCQPLFFMWTHETSVVNRNVTFNEVGQYSSFKFSKPFNVNLTMMGERASYPFGDPNAPGVYYSCFAPIVQTGTLAPNFLWAACPWQKQPCLVSAEQKGSCVASWKTHYRTGVAYPRDVEYMLRDSIQKQAELWKMGPTPPRFVVLHWEDIETVFDRSFKAWWISLLVGNSIILLWWVIRRPFLAFFCGTSHINEYSALN